MNHEKHEMNFKLNGLVSFQIGETMSPQLKQRHELVFKLSFSHQKKIQEKQP